MPPPPASRIRRLNARPCSERLLGVISEGREVHGPAGAYVERVQELHHRVDLVGEFRHREGRNLGFEGLEPGGADRQVHPLAFDLRRLRDRAFDLAEFWVVGMQPRPCFRSLDDRVADRNSDPEISSTTELALYFSFICRIVGSILWKSSRFRSTSIKSSLRPMIPQVVQTEKAAVSVSTIAGSQL